MILTAIWHQTHSEYSYQVSEDSIHILLRAASNDIKSVQLIYGDPFHWQKDNTSHYYWDMQLDKMELKYTEDLFDYFFINVLIPSKRIRYAFLITDTQNNQLIYHSKGFMDIPKPFIFTDLNSFFNYPYLHTEDMTNTPDWVKNVIWYQIFPDRFYNYENPSTLDWNNQKVANDEIYGGNLKGITKKLPYLKEIGFSGIYLTPIFKANTAHKYDTIDYYQIDPSFGTNEDFKNLVDSAHQLGIKIMLDGVFNHVGFFHPYFLDVSKHNNNSRYAKAFKIKQWPAVDFNVVGNKIIRDDTKSPNYETFATTAYMPKWNFESKITQDYLLDVVKYWITEYNIDAWRLDVSNEISFEFLRKIRKAALKANPNVYILGENWDQSLPWLKGDTLDGVMNYFLTSIIWDFIDHKIDNHEFNNRLVKYLVGTPKNIINNQFNLISSHDTERIKHRVSGDIRRVKLAFVLLFLSQGTPCVYYGDEIGLDGGGDPDNRRTMIWDQSKWDHEMLTFIKKMIKLRSSYHSFDNDVVITRYDNILILKQGSLTIVINNSNQEQLLNINFSGLDVYNQNRIDILKSDKIKPYEFLLLKED